MSFPNKPYISLEEPDMREYAKTDPRGFLGQFPGGAILDEIQHSTELASYIQTIVDRPDFMGNYILTGSRNLSVRSNISQSLAGRTALLTLLPFSLHEISEYSINSGIDQLIYNGGFPRIHHRKLNPTQILSDYAATYVERDVRQLSMIKDLYVFQKFLRLCAGRTGQLLNLASLSNDAGISQPTVKEWLSVLEAGYICFRLPPYFANISKRLVKTLKLYFYDTGLAAYLMGINSVEQIEVHPLRGMLFENLIITEIMKHFMNTGHKSDLMFYRDSNGNEVDLIIRQGSGYIPIEIKSSATVSSSFFKGLRRFKTAAGSSDDGILVYAGKDSRIQNGTQVTNLNNLIRVIDRKNLIP